jgi:hypothetical protein
MPPDTLLHVFLEGVFMGHWGPPCLFGGRVVIKIPGVGLLYAPDHRRSLAIWSLHNGHLLIETDDIVPIRRYLKEYVTFISSPAICPPPDLPTIIRRWESDEITCEKLVLIRFRATSEPTGLVLPQLIAPPQPTPSRLPPGTGQPFKKVDKLLSQMISKDTTESWTNLSEDNCSDKSLVIPKMYCVGPGESRSNGIIKRRIHGNGQDIDLLMTRLSTNRITGSTKI